MAPLLSRFGITRVSDVTGLDTLGVPVAMAVRPLAKTLTVSQGKGRTYALARVSAAMESVELWHAEQVRPALVHSLTSAGDLRLPYQVRDLDTVPGSLLDDSTPLDWIVATGACTGRPVPVPAELARLTGADETRWRPPGLAQSSSGLASGNSREEAVLHAVYEVVERDALDPVAASTDLWPVDPASVPDAGGAELVAGIRRAGARLDIVRVGNRVGVPTFAARVWSPDFPVSCLGYGAHLSAEVAVCRAVTEAAQSRLTSIVGSRDDLVDLSCRLGEEAVPPLPAGAVAGWAAVTADRPPDLADIGAELDQLCAAIRVVTGVEPLVVELATEPEFAVVKVVAPGLRAGRELIHPERSAAAVTHLFAGTPGKGSG